MLSIPDLETILSTGAIEPRGQFIYGSNHTYLVTVSARTAGEAEPVAINAVYKPQRGERPLWDFPDGSLAAREVAAYRLSELLGWHLVPPTVPRQNGPFGPGSLQLFIEHDPNRHYFSLPDAQLPRLMPVALFDLLCNNADRKGSHIIFREADDHLFAIDHGLCFHTEDKLRTVIWNFAETPIPAALLADVRRVFANQNQTPTTPASFSNLFADLLSPDEIAALAARGQAYLSHPFFPAPPDASVKRAYPYPPL